MNDGKIEIRVNKQNLNYKNSKILYAIIKSRHSNSSKYSVYCKYIPYTNNITGIESWYCTCKAGMRTVGCCSHIASIIYYFAHGKYLEFIPNPAADLFSLFPYREKESSERNKEKIKKSKLKKKKTEKMKNESDIESKSESESESDKV